MEWVRELMGGRDAHVQLCRSPTWRGENPCRARASRCNLEGSTAASSADRGPRRIRWHRERPSARSCRFFGNPRDLVWRIGSTPYDQRAASVSSRCPSFARLKSRMRKHRTASISPKPASTRPLCYGVPVSCSGRSGARRRASSIPDFRPSPRCRSAAKAR